MKSPRAGSVKLAEYEGLSLKKFAPLSKNESCVRNEHDKIITQE